MEEEFAVDETLRSDHAHLDLGCLAIAPQTAVLSLHPAADIVFEVALRCCRELGGVSEELLVVNDRHRPAVVLRCQTRDFF